MPFVSSCANIDVWTIDSSRDFSGRSYHSASSEQNVDDSQNEPNEYDEVDAKKFEYYKDRIRDVDQVWCFKKDNNEWYSGFSRKGSGYPNMPTINHVMESEACPLPIMRQIISECKQDSTISILELEYPMTDDAYQQIFFSYGSYASRNKPLYEALGIVSSYESFYGNDEYHDISGCIDDDRTLLMYSKYFSYESHVFCWLNGDDQWECGVGVENEDGLSLYAAYWMQEDNPCSLAGMKKIIDAYYGVYSHPKANKIIEIQIIETESQRKSAFADYPNNVSNNDYLYSALGL